MDPPRKTPCMSMHDDPKKGDQKCHKLNTVQVVAVGQSHLHCGTDVGIVAIPDFERGLLCDAMLWEHRRYSYGHGSP